MIYQHKKSKALYLPSQVKYKVGKNEIMACEITKGGRGLGDPVRIKLKDFQKADEDTILSLPNLTVSKVVERTGIARSTLAAMINQYGKLAAYRRGRMRFVPIAEVIRYERENKKNE